MSSNAVAKAVFMLEVALGMNPSVRISAINEAKAVQNAELQAAIKAGMFNGEDDKAAAEFLRKFN